MKPEIKTKWVAALRSGSYKQGKEALRIGDNYCCLGVLCDLYAKEHNKPELWINQLTQTNKFSFGILDGIRGADYSYGIPPEIVQEWAGFIISGNPEVIHNGEKITLSRINDRLNADFNTIADIIDKQL